MVTIILITRHGKYIFNALGIKVPVFAHLPMILGDDGKRMSKRHGAVSVMQYEKDGILPHAMLNYLARLGWSHGDQEIFSIQELLELFALEDCQKSGSVFDTTKLLWVNQQHMANQTDDELGAALNDALQLNSVSVADGPPVSKVAAVLKERAVSYTHLTLPTKA